MVQLILSTFPDADTARRIANALVEERLTACVNLVSGVQSIYRWNGKAEEAAEVLGIFKTTPERAAALRDRLKALHPYEVPEIVSLAPGECLDAYAAWVRTAVTGG